MSGIVKFDVNRFLKTKNDSLFARWSDVFIMVLLLLSVIGLNFHINAIYKGSHNYFFNQETLKVDPGLNPDLFIKPVSSLFKKVLNYNHLNGDRLILRVKPYTNNTSYQQLLSLRKDLLPLGILEGVDFFQDFELLGQRFVASNKDYIRLVLWGRFKVYGLESKKPLRSGLIYVLVSLPPIINSKGAYPIKLSSIDYQIKQER